MKQHHNRHHFTQVHLTHSVPLALLHRQQVRLPPGRKVLAEVVNGAAQGSKEKFSWISTHGIVTQRGQWHAVYVPAHRVSTGKRLCWRRMSGAKRVKCRWAAGHGRSRLALEIGSKRREKRRKAAYPNGSGQRVLNKDGHSRVTGDRSGLAQPSGARLPSPYLPDPRPRRQRTAQAGAGEPRWIHAACVRY
jgi:hypothetical protein